ncbi:MAG: TrmH family RNA methyltransferase [Bacillota bacterium]
MEPVTSVRNPLVKYMARLKRRRFRDQEGKFVVEGVRLVEEALGSGWPVDAVLYCEELSGSRRGAGLLERALRENIRTVLVDSKIIDELSCTEAPQGIVALCGMKKWPGEDGKRILKHASTEDNLVVVVDGVRDPGNLGTIIRSADAFGAGLVILTRGTVDLYNDKTLRATMGSVFHLPVLDGINPLELKGLFPGDRFSLVMGVPAGGVPVDRLDLRRPVALLVGGEAAGPSPEAAALPHVKATIPMRGKAESLNAGVAASVMLYEIMRQRSGG